MPTLKGTEALLPYTQCFLYLVFPSINVSIFHKTGWILSGQTFHGRLVLVEESLLYNFPPHLAEGELVLSNFLSHV